jgi:hypothetical protein
MSSRKRHCFDVSSIAHNVLQLGEVADFERQMFDLAQMFIRTPILDFSTEPAILPNCCYKLSAVN